jgi:hypothetical protein
MKIILTIIICIAIFNTSCTKNSTTPTTPPATTNPCGYTTNSNEYIELKINGNTIKNEALIINGATTHLSCQFITDQTRRYLSIGEGRMVCTLNSAIINNLEIYIYASKTSNYLEPIGNYAGNYAGRFSYYSSTTGTIKNYGIPKDSFSLNVTKYTPYLVSGTFVGTALETNTNIPYPITGSFNNLQRNGF